MVKIIIILLILYFLQFKLVVFGENIFCQTYPTVQSRSRSRKNTSCRSRLGKKSGAGAAWKKSQEPEPELLKN